MAQSQVTSKNAVDLEHYEPRRSARVSTNLQADGDTWQETLAVCEGAGNKLLIRSYYRNIRSGKRVWDEPPSGASHIKPATEDMRRMANSQLQEMQLVFSAFPYENDNDKENIKEPKKRGFFRWKNNKTNKRGGKFRKGKQPQSKGRQNPNDESLDPALQKALALSMGMDEPVVRSEVPWEKENEDIALATALSMSEANPKTEGDDDEMLRKALEASRLDAVVASNPHPVHDQDLISSYYSGGHGDPSSLDNRKMPPTAAPKKKPPPPQQSYDDEHYAVPAASARLAPQKSPGKKKPPPPQSDSLGVAVVEKKPPPPQSYNDAIQYSKPAASARPTPQKTNDIFVPTASSGVPISGSFDAYTLSVSSVSDSFGSVSPKPAEMFDPYSKAAQAASPPLTSSGIVELYMAASSGSGSRESQDSAQKASSDLKKMEPNDGRRKLGRVFARRVSSKRVVKNKAGVV